MSERSPEVTFTGQEIYGFPRYEKPFCFNHPRELMHLGISHLTVVIDGKEKDASIIYFQGAHPSLGTVKEKGLSGGAETAFVDPPELTETLRPYI